MGLVTWAQATSNTADAGTSYRSVYNNNCRPSLHWVPQILFSIDSVTLQLAY